MFLINGCCDVNGTCKCVIHIRFAFVPQLFYTPVPVSLKCNEFRRTREMVAEWRRGGGGNVDIEDDVANLYKIHKCMFLVQFLGKFENFLLSCINVARPSVTSLTQKLQISASRNPTFHQTHFHLSRDDKTDQPNFWPSQRDSSDQLNTPTLPPSLPHPPHPQHRRHNQSVLILFNLIVTSPCKSHHTPNMVIILAAPLRNSPTP
ncbi:hypothetical protein HELRODRAFT_168193 [Helobdella robusta]|uniref:Uncharacterized protein n=1 Tax=Helobdella robusta TaxID=6412 RepID=T1F0A2_HELRO|nr:hypothetical protein HELRODRAFT_168193 [Helobdella robusta]ESO09231.1 hypothetical protein HELRODRAFT_168193 [Helobdella robusta]